MGTFARGIFLCALTAGLITGVAQGKPMSSISVANAMGIGIAYLFTGLLSSVKAGGVFNLLPVSVAAVLYILRLRNMGREWAWVFLAGIPFISMCVTVPCLLTPGKGESDAGKGGKGRQYIFLALVAIALVSITTLAIVRKIAADIAPVTAPKQTTAAPLPNTVQAPSIMEDTRARPKAPLTTLSLPYGIKLDVPSEWHVKADGLSQPLEPDVQTTKPVDALDLSKGAVVLLEAGVFDPQKVVITVSVENQEPGTDKFARSATEEQVKQYARKYYAKTQRDLNEGDTRLTVEERVRPETRIIGRYWSIIMSDKLKEANGTEYERTITQIFVNDKTITINMTSDTKAEPRLVSALNRAENSLRISP
jgi:uncharacterized membrane protein YhaH (DUF805 family)